MKKLLSFLFIIISGTSLSAQTTWKAATARFQLTGSLMRSDFNVEPKIQAHMLAPK
ncbi:MAG: hypothetical protein WKF97_07335 [Chitinophagaceae bacterium]